MILSDDDLALIRRNSKDQQAFEQLLALFERLPQRVEKFLQSEIDAMSDHVAVLDQFGNILSVNKAWREFGKVNGYANSGYGVGINYLEVCDNVTGELGGEARKVAQGIQDVLNGRLQEFHLDYPCHSPQEQRWFTVSVKPFRVDDAQYVVVVHHDITLRTLLNQALKRSEYLYRTLTNNLPISAVFMFDRDLRYILAEGPAIAAAGLDKNAYIGKTLADVFPPEIAERDTPILREALAGKTTIVEVPFNDFYYQVQTLPVYNDADEIIGGMVLTQDITAIKHAEAMLREQEKRIVALEKEQELSQLKSRMMSRMSHEFRTPLAVLQSSVEMFHRYHDRLSPEMRQERTERIKTEVQHLTRMLDDMTFVVTGQQNKLRVEKSVFDITVLCESVVVEMTLIDRRHKVTRDVQTGLPPVNADKSMIRSIMTNLLSNAFKYSPSGTEVTLRLYQDGRDIVLEVRDQGIGMSETVKARIFEPFYRADVSNEIEGMGLGLSIMKEAVEVHAGQISVESVEGEGTTFTVRLPIAVM
jgi:PAS domain S-box-containing protein